MSANLINPSRTYNAALQNGRIVNVTEDGYSPNVLHLPANQPVSLYWVTENTKSCARSVVIPGLKYQQILPTTGRIELDIPAQTKGTIIRYSCSMGMHTGQFIFDQDN